MTDDPIMTEQTDLMQYVPKVHFEQIPIKNKGTAQTFNTRLGLILNSVLGKNSPVTKIIRVEITVCTRTITK